MRNFSILQKIVVIIHVVIGIGLLITHLLTNYNFVL